MTRQGTFETSTHVGSDASLLAQQLDVQMASADSLRTSSRVRLAVALSVDEALCELGTFAFVVLHFFYAGGEACISSCRAPSYH